MHEKENGWNCEERNESGIERPVRWHRSLTLFRIRIPDVRGCVRARCHREIVIVQLRHWPGPVLCIFIVSLSRVVALIKRGWTCKFLVCGASSRRIAFFFFFFPEFNLKGSSLNKTRAGQKYFDVSFRIFSKISESEINRNGGEERFEIAKNPNCREEKKVDLFQKRRCVTVATRRTRGNQSRDVAYVCKRCWITVLHGHSSYKHERYYEYPFRSINLIIVLREKFHETVGNFKDNFLFFKWDTFIGYNSLYCSFLCLLLAKVIARLGIVMLTKLFLSSAIA